MSSHLYEIDDEHVYERIRTPLLEGDLILFAGSGLSAQAKTDDGRKPPLWRGLLLGMIDWSVKRDLINKSDGEEICKLVEAGFLTEAGQEIQEHLERAQLQLCLGEVILCNEARASEAHRLIARLPFRAFLTTNYDEFIEGEYRAEHGVMLLKFYERSIDAVMNAYRGRKPFIFKLHGDINDIDSIILGNRSYEKLLNGDTAYRSCVESIFNMSSILFIGFGGGDPDLDRIISRVAPLDGRSKRHWMLVPKNSFPPLKAERLWKDKGINVISYEPDKEHSGLSRFLHRLATRVSIPRSDYIREAPKIIERSTKVEGFETL